MDYGFVKVASAIPSVRVADCRYNVEQMLPIIKEAEEKNIEILAFPELSITSYSCADLFQQQLLLKEAEKGVARLLKETLNYNIIIIIGIPIPFAGTLLNCAVVIHNGEIMGAVPSGI